MRAKRMGALALLATLALTPVPALASPGDAPAGGPAEGHPRGQGLGGDGVDAWVSMADRHMRQLMAQLKMTPEQRGKVETIRARHMEQTQPLRAELGKKRAELFAMVRGARATRDQAIAKQREVDALHARLSEARLTAWFEARGVLTPDQLAQLEKLPAGRQGGWKRPHRRTWENR